MGIAPRCKISDERFFPQPYSLRKTENDKNDKTDRQTNHGYYNKALSEALHDIRNILFNSVLLSSVSASDVGTYSSATQRLAFAGVQQSR